MAAVSWFLVWNVQYWLMLSMQLFRISFSLAAFLLEISVSQCLYGLDPAVDTTKYTHTIWRQWDGNALPSIDAMAQTRDGYLWLGTKLGLLRFDGVKFTAWMPFLGEGLPSDRIRTLLAASDGSLWIGSSTSVSQLRAGRLTNYSSAQGIPDAPVIAMLEGPDGTLWVGTGGGQQSGLVAIDHGSLKIYRAADGLPDSNVLSLFVD